VVFKAVVKKIWGFIKKNWKPILSSIVTLLFVLFVYSKVKNKRRGQRGRVDSPQNFIPINKHTIVVKSEEGEWIEAELPEDMDAKDVIAAQIVGEKTVTLEVMHEKTDRRNATPRSNSALDRLGL